MPRPSVSPVRPRPLARPTNSPPNKTESTALLNKDELFCVGAWTAIIVCYVIAIVSYPEAQRKRSLAAFPLPLVALPTDVA